ncbi:MAG: hypothetical protein LBC80_03860 [Treponema sp.]|jgi:hypothetical protein|nr:hypothetical protein [Treponema sp.]
MMIQFSQWLKIQRLSLFLYLAFSVFLLVYALGFLSDVYIFYTYGSDELENFYHYMQGINSGLLWKAILVIVFALVLFVLELNKYPAGLFTLIVVVFIAAIGLVISANSFIELMEARQQYTVLDLSPLNRYIERETIRYRYSTTIFDFGLVVYTLMFFSSLFMAATVTRNAIKVTVKEKP